MNSASSTHSATVFIEDLRNKLVQASPDLGAIKALVTENQPSDINIYTIGTVVQLLRNKPEICIAFLKKAVSHAQIIKNEEARSIFLQTILEHLEALDPSPTKNKAMPYIRQTYLNSVALQMPRSVDWGKQTLEADEYGDYIKQDQINGFVAVCLPFMAKHQDDVLTALQTIPNLDYQKWAAFDLIRLHPKIYENETIIGILSAHGLRCINDTHAKTRQDLAPDTQYPKGYLSAINSTYREFMTFPKKAAAQCKVGLAGLADLIIQDTPAFLSALAAEKENERDNPWDSFSSLFALYSLSTQDKSPLAKQHKALEALLTTCIREHLSLHAYNNTSAFAIGCRLLPSESPVIQTLLTQAYRLASESNGLIYNLYGLAHENGLTDLFVTIGQRMSQAHKLDTYEIEALSRYQLPANDHVLAALITRAQADLGRVITPEPSPRSQFLINARWVEKKRPTNTHFNYNNETVHVSILQKAVGEAICAGTYSQNLPKSISPAEADRHRNSYSYHLQLYRAAVNNQNTTLSDHLCTIILDKLDQENAGDKYKIASYLLRECTPSFNSGGMWPNDNHAMALQMLSQTVAAVPSAHITDITEKNHNSYNDSPRYVAELKTYCHLYEVADRLNAPEQAAAIAVNILHTLRELGAPETSSRLYWQTQLHRATVSSSYGLPLAFAVAAKVAHTLDYNFPLAKAVCKHMLEQIHGIPIKDTHMALQSLRALTANDTPQRSADVYYCGRRGKHNFPDIVAALDAATPPKRRAPKAALG